MLVLSRRVGETCIIGDSISVTVLRVNGNQVRLGIAAPTEIPVHREETLARIRAERRGNEPHLRAPGSVRRS